MNREVSQSFVRNIRKAYLQPDGTPKPGEEERCLTLLKIIKLLQAGSYSLAIKWGNLHGYDLEAMYSDYRSLVRASRSLGNYWQRVETWCRKYGVNIIWNEKASA